MRRENIYDVILKPHVFVLSPHPPADAVMSIYARFQHYICTPNMFTVWTIKRILFRSSWED